MSIEQFRSRINSLPLVQQFEQYRAQNQARMNDPAFQAEMQAIQRQIEADPQYQQIIGEAQQFQNQQLAQQQGAQPQAVAQRTLDQFGTRIQNLPLVQQLTQFQQQNQNRMDDPAVINQMLAIQQQIMDDPQYQQINSEAQQFQQQQQAQMQGFIGNNAGQQAGLQDNQNGGFQNTSGLPPTGLIGREQALQAGLTGALQGVEQGYNQGRQDIAQGVQGAENLLREAYGAGAGEIRQGVQGQEALLREAYAEGEGQLRLGGDRAENLLREAYGAGAGELRSGRDAGIGALAGAANQATGAVQNANRSALGEILQGRTDTTQGLQGAMGSLQQGFGRGIAGFQPYQAAGTEALNPLSALSGARGQDAFNQAYIDNPYVNFLREQGERSVVGNASATGGLRGGDVMKELTRFGQGLAGQGIQQQIGNLQFLTGQGMNAAQGIGQLSGQQATSMASAQQNAANMLTGQSNLAAQQQANTGANLADIGMTTGANVSNLLSGTGANIANLASGLGSTGAQVRANQGSNAASLAQGLGTQGAGNIMQGGQLLSGLAQNIGTQGAQNVYGGGLANAQAALGAGNQAGQFAFTTGNNLAQGRTSAGDMLAGQVAGTAAGMGALANQQGQGVAGVFDAQTQNLVNILTQNGMSQADIQRIIAQSRAGAAQTGAGQFAGLPGIPGTQQTTGVIGNMANAAAGAGTLMALSDYRLKDNITLQSNHNGVNLYSWNWKPEFSDITAGMPTQGVIAQEVAITHPDAVFMTKSGFLAVDYSKVN